MDNNGSKDYFKIVSNKYYTISYYIKLKMTKLTIFKNEHYLKYTFF